MAEHRRPRFSINVLVEKSEDASQQIRKVVLSSPCIFGAKIKQRKNTYILEIHLVRSFKWPAWIEYPSCTGRSTAWLNMQKQRKGLQIMYIWKSTNFRLCVDVFWHRKLVAQYRIRYPHQSQHAGVGYFKWCFVETQNYILVVESVSKWRSLN